MLVQRSNVLFVFLVASAVILPSTYGQAIVDSSYRPLEIAEPSWPPFYKSDPGDAKYSRLMAGGWCQATGKRAREYYASKLLDVNALPSSMFEGKITQIGTGRIEVCDDHRGSKVIFIIHDNSAVSSVSVRGKTTLAALAQGAFVHLVASVDDSGEVREPVERLELTTATRHPPERVVPNRSQNLGGTILRHESSQLILGMPPGKIHRVTIHLTPQAEVTVELSDYRLASVGDTVSAKGRIYHSVAPEPTLLFVEQLDVTLHGEKRP